MKTPPSWFIRPWPWKGYPENRGVMAARAGVLVNASTLLLLWSLSHVIAHHHPDEVINVTNEVIIDVGPEHA